MNPIIINTHFARDCATIVTAAESLQRFCDRLQNSGAELPAYLYVRPLAAEIVFTRPALPKLTALFGRDGWRRESSGCSHFDWTKKVEQGVTIRVSECEEQPQVNSGVDAAAVKLVESAA